MRAIGAEWLFVGEHGGPIEADRLTAANGFDAILANGGARLFRLRQR